jgi:hypothetical protein
MRHAVADRTINSRTGVEIGVFGDCFTPAGENPSGAEVVEPGPTQAIGGEKMLLPVPNKKAFAGRKVPALAVSVYFTDSCAHPEEFWGRK